MKGLLAFAFEEARASLIRGGRGAIMSVGTIAIAFLALGGFLLVTTNLQQFVRQWMESAEFSVFLRDDIQEVEREAVRTRLSGDAGVQSVDYLSKEAALERFRTDFPELADVSTTVGTNPFPASFEVRLQAGPRVADTAAALSEAVTPLDGVADVQFDRRWLERVLSLIAGIRAAGFAVTVVLLLGAAFTVTAVVRLSLHARRDELDIMQLVGAPLGFIRGPFIIEGLLLGGIGAIVALVALRIGFWLFQGWLGGAAVGVLSGGTVDFLGVSQVLLLTLAGLAVGALAGVIASRAAR
ncbi:MAG TPA: ABC transporter permease [Vicinamibacterales bacterium]|nr:ABC transporter permease [Vicinamibacterales bacterium]